MDEKLLTVPYVALESERARHERERKHERTLWFIVVIVLILLLFGTNAAWINYEAQFVDEVTETIETSADGGGNAYGTIISGDNSGVNYGESEGNANQEAH